MRVRDYISPSQLETFYQGKKAYIDTYILGIRRENKYLLFGSKIADGLQYRSRKTKDKDVLMARKLVPKFKFPEKEIRVTWGGVPMFGKLDGFGKLDFYVVDEVKTSKNGWTQNRVDKLDQITFYVVLVWQFFKVKNPADIVINLHYLETYEDTDGSLHLTGIYKVFKSKRTLPDLLKFYIELKRVWLDIEELVNEYVES